MIPRTALFLLLLALFAAGCVQNPPAVTDDASAADRASFQCAAGQAVVGFDAADRPECGAAVAPFSCPEGQFVRGFGSTGTPLCGVPGAAVPQPTQEVSSNLKVVNVYGVRPDTTQNLRGLMVQIELSAGALPLDLTKLILRYSDGANVQTYSYGGGASGFSTTWIRGANNSAVMESGDLVELKFPLGEPLATRTSVQLTLIPETGSPVEADFKTPATYGTDTTITLR